MLPKTLRNLTIRASAVNSRNCLKKIAMKIQLTQFVMLVCSIFVLSGTSSATTFTGFFEDNSPSNLYVDIPLNLATASVVNLTYTDSCSDPDNAEMELYNAWESSMKNCWYGTCLPQPWGPLPLAAGNWTVRLHCQNESYNTDNPVAYKLEQSIEAGVSQFSEDSEPDATSEEAITLTSGRVFSGWIGYQGYSGLYTESNLHGLDIWDDYYFSLTAGTKIKIKLDYDQTLVNALGDRDISIETYRREGYNLYNYTHFDFSNWWQFSGDTTDEFTIPQDGIYLFRVVGGYGSAPKTNFGGYRMSVIVNGEQAPNAKIGGIHKISTQYKPVDSDNFTTIEKLVPGNASLIDISITNYGSKSIATTLAYGLSEDIKGPTKYVGATKLNLTPDNNSNIYSTWLKTPADFQDITKVYLVAVLYGSSNEVLDTYTTKVDVFSQNKEVALTFLYLLLHPAGEL